MQWVCPTMIVQMGHFEGEVVSTMPGFLPLLNAFRGTLIRAGVRV